MTERTYTILLSNNFLNHLNESYQSDDPDCAKIFRAWGKCLSDHSKQFSSLADAIECENSKGADIEIDFFGVEQTTCIGFYGALDALKRLADEGLIEDITDENESE